MAADPLAAWSIFLGAYHTFDLLGMSDPHLK
jgi:hypothetical protein